MDARTHPPVTLRAGPLTMVFVAGGLRGIRAGGHEVVSHIYAAVRDASWGTVPGRLSEVVTDVRADGFAVTFVSEHRLGDVDFVWRGRIVGHAGGLEFTFSGEARSGFRRNRVGFCVLHPASLAGAPYTAEHTDGTVSAGAFPDDIAPHQPVLGLRALRYGAGPGAAVTLRFEGDTFETEDQRNWTDASFKTYCTPLAAPRPVAVTPGERVEQRVTLTLSGTPTEPATETNVVVRVDPRNPVALPRLGLVANGAAVSAAGLGHLKALNLAYLRVDLDLGGAYGAVLERAAALAAALGVGLELALHVGANPGAEFGGLRSYLRALGTRPERLLVFGKGAKSTPADLLGRAHTVFGELGVPLGGGTDAFFAELNREPPPADRLDFMAYSLNPQVHAFDDASLVETLPVQGVTVDGARRLAGGKPVAVGPVTLKMRWNPDAAPPTTGQAETGQVRTGQADLERRDPRQRTLFNAAWTLGSIKYLAQHGAASATYFEPVGPLGVMDERGVFPVYHVFADVGAFAGGAVYSSRPNHPRRVESLVLQQGSRVRVLLANFGPVSAEVTLTGVRGGFRCRMLDEQNAAAAAQDPETFRTVQGTPLELPGPVSLPPRAYACLDLR